MLLSFESSSRNQMIEITDDINQLVKDSGFTKGMCLVYVPHTTAAVTVNENADRSVAVDILTRLSELVPEHAGYRHGEGNADAHIKATIVGGSVVLPVEKGSLALGTWQGVFLCEFDGPRRRQVRVEFLEAS